MSDKKYVYLERFENYTKHQHELRLKDKAEIEKHRKILLNLALAVIFETIALVALSLCFALQ